MPGPASVVLSAPVLGATLTEDPKRGPNAWPVMTVSSNAPLPVIDNGERLPEELSHESVPFQLLSTLKPVKVKAAG